MKKAELIRDLLRKVAEDKGDTLSISELIILLDYFASLKKKSSAKGSAVAKRIIY